MSRQARVVVEAVPHHATQRGNNRQDIFLCDDDRRFYLQTLRQKSEQFGLAILGYCLMTNHVHVVAVPRRADSLAKALGQTHWRHAMRFNRLHRRSGHLWQNRFYSCPLGPSRLATALAYVDLNPVRARLVECAEDHLWSSARAHLTGHDEHELLDDWVWNECRLQNDWAATLARGSAEADDRALRTATYAGIPHGQDAFIDGLEKAFYRRLRPSPPGPKPRALAATAG